MTARLRVNLSALAANYRTIATAVDAAGAVVKADAYGLGALPVSTALLAAGCRDFFVASGAEALQLLAALQDSESAGQFPDLRVFCFAGPTAENASALAQARVVPVINHPEQLGFWRPHRELPIAVHVDTGMMRLGFTPAELQPAVLEGFRPTLLLTHFACADDPDAVLNGEQLERFRAVSARFPDVPVSLGNSAASMAMADSVQGLARPGIALYGGRALRAADSSMQPVASFEAQVIQLRSLAAGDSVGYGATWVAPRAAKIAIVGAGYADGVRRALSNRGEAFCREQSLPVVGRVSMDLTAVDVTDADVRLGDWVEWFGLQQPLAAVADQLDTIDYEVLTSIGPRVRREYFSG